MARLGWWHACRSHGNRRLTDRARRLAVSEWSWRARAALPRAEQWRVGVGHGAFQQKLRGVDLVRGTRRDEFARRTIRSRTAMLSATRCPHSGFE
jgi:hypothetical protein